MKRFTVAAMLLLSLAATGAQASMIVTLSKSGINDVLATFEGSGVTSGTSSVSTKANLGNAFLVNGQTATLDNPLTFGTVSITQMVFDDDSGIGDDWVIFFSDNLVSGTAFDISASSLLSGVLFTDLIQGTYAGGIELGVDVGDLTLVITEFYAGAGPSEPPIPTPAPAGIALFGLALMALAAQRRLRQR